jgi:hypothetical protein
MTLRSPVAIFVYNREMHIQAILEQVRAARPKRLYVFGDGPKDESEDRARCASVRSCIVAFKFPFPVEFSFAPTNLGNYGRFVSGIDEVFKCEERAIFIDDDVELSQSFFPYCDWLLNLYQHQEKIEMISGVNPLSNWPTAGATCFFSKLGNAQAWGTWRRAWRFYSGARDLWLNPETRVAVAEFLNDPDLFAWRASIYESRIKTTWDFQWSLARHARRTLCAIPAKSLATHCGRGPLASHVKTRGILDAIAERHEIETPFQAPAAIVADTAFDRLYFEATQNMLSTSSARWLAERLIARGHHLLAIAVLRHSSAGEVSDPAIAELIEEAFSRAVDRPVRQPARAERDRPNPKTRIWT